MAGWFLLIVFAGFLPDSVMKIAMVRAGARPPFPIVMHMHAALMGTFMLLLLAQSTLMATGRRALHMQLGIVAFAFVPLLVVVGVVLAPTIYHQVWGFAQTAAPEMKTKLQQRLLSLDNILLIQIQVGILFPILMAIGLKARAGNAGLHKRMMFLATAVPLPAAFDRMEWLPTTLPGSPLACVLYVMMAVSPMFLWDVVRNRRVHEAYWIWLALYVPASVVMIVLWDTPLWHNAARAMMGV